MKKIILLLVILSSVVMISAKGEDYVSFKVIFNIEGELLEFSVRKGDTIGSIKKPVKEGYDFIGWFKNGIIYDFSLPVTEDIELIANFKVIDEQTNDPLINEPKKTSKLLIYSIITAVIVASIPAVYYFKTKNDINL